MPDTSPDTPDYQVFPRVVPEGWSGTLKVTGDYAHSRLVPGVRYEYSLASVRWYADSRRRREPVTGKLVADKRGGLTIPFAPDVPGEWVLTVTSRDKRVRTLPTLGLYVVAPSLRRLRPYVGELHAHSIGSDGRQEPAYCAIRARELGYDFFTLTDHNNYASSLDMIRTAQASLGRRMLLMPGEELHDQPAAFHYVGIGHSESVMEWGKRHPQRRRAEMNRILRELKGRPNVPRLDIAAYAKGLWKVRKAKELGGLVLFAHPYWGYRNTLNIDEAEREQTFADREFDAVEIATSAEDSSLMANRIAYETAAGRGTPVVGVSDAHNWAPGSAAGRHWTYVLARGLTQQAVFEAIRSGRSVSCQDLNGRLRLAGPFDLIDFAEFYHRRLLPLKRRIMALEAQLAFSGLRGEAYERGLALKLDRQLARLEKRLWA